MAYDSQSPLIGVRGTLMGQCYVDDIVRFKHLLNCLPGAFFWQDNVHPHIAQVAEDFLRHV